MLEFEQTSAKEDVYVIADPVAERNFIIGIGVARGGHAKLSELLRHSRRKPELAFVVILSPVNEAASLSVPDLQKLTSSPVIKAETGQLVRSGCIYLVPADAHAELLDGKIKLSLATAGEKQSSGVDIFLRSLAQDQGEKSIAIIFAGHDGHGVDGAIAISEAGGIAVSEVSQAGSLLSPSSSVYEESGMQGVRLNSAEQHLFDLFQERFYTDFSSLKRSALKKTNDRRVALSDVNGLGPQLQQFQSDHLRFHEQLEAADVSLIFLDSELRLRNFTPNAAKHFQAIREQVGEPIQLQNMFLNYPEINADLEAARDQQRMLNRTVYHTDGSPYLVKTCPGTNADLYRGLCVAFVGLPHGDAKDPMERPEEGLLNTLMESVSEGICSVSAAGTIQFCNRAACALLARTANELVGMDAQMVFSDAELVNPETGVWAPITEGDSFHSDTITLRKSDGSVIPVEMWIQTVVARDNRGDYVITFVNISRRKARIQATQNSIKKRDQFFATLSHELRNPLSAITNSAQLLNSMALPSDAFKSLNTIVDQSNHVAHLIDDLLDTARISQGKINLTLENLDLVEVTLQAHQSVQATVLNMKHNILLSLPDEPVVVKGDRHRLMQIQTNLIHNAIKYTQDGGQIKIEVSRQKDQALFCVTDNGFGIPKGLQDKLFEPFIQAEQHIDRRDGGLGVGLTLVKTLTELHYGKVSVRSDGASCGSQFTVHLPCSESEPASVQPHTRKSLRPIRALEIVLIEDNTDARDSMIKLLNAMGHKATPAADGESGLALVLRSNPDVALVDIGLPGMDGFTVASEFRKVQQAVSSSDHQLNTTMIALTGFGHADDREATARAGFDAHLVKPIPRGELGELLDTVSISNSLSGKS